MKHTSGNDLTINLNGSIICYDDHGRGSIPIIFIHGFPFNKSTWRPQVECFRKNNRVIAYDVRGFGKSTMGNEKVSISLFAHDLIKFMNALEISKAIVCGLSMGGYILLNAVNLYPERFESIILCDTQCIGDSVEMKEKRNQTIENIKTVGIKGFAEEFIKTIFCKDSFYTKKELIEKIRYTILSTSPHTIVETIAALSNRLEMCSNLQNILAPTLILCGKNDTVTPPEQARFMQSKIKNSTLAILNKSGHLSNLEQPNVFNKHFSDFALADMLKEKDLIKQTKMSFDTVS